MVKVSEEDGRVRQEMYKTVSGMWRTRMACRGQGQSRACRGKVREGKAGAGWWVGRLGQVA